MIKTILNLIFLLCLLDFLYGYYCPSTMLLRKNCTVKILHCLPLYPDWNKYELVCSEAKSFVPGTCPVYFKVEKIITSVPCPPIYYTDEIYRSNNMEVPKLKQNCTEEGQLTLLTNSTLNNLCYCVEDYSFQRNDTYCDPTIRNCTCHRNTTDVIKIDDSFDLLVSYAPVVAVFSILAFIGIAGLSLKCRNPQPELSEIQGDEMGDIQEGDIPHGNNDIDDIDVNQNDIIVNVQLEHGSIQETQGLSQKCNNPQLKLSEIQGDEEGDIQEGDIPHGNNDIDDIDVNQNDIIVNAQLEHRSIQETQDEHHTDFINEYHDDAIQTEERRSLIDYAKSDENDIPDFTRKPCGTIPLTKIAESDDEGSMKQNTNILWDAGLRHPAEPKGEICVSNAKF